MKTPALMLMLAALGLAAPAVAAKSDYKRPAPTAQETRAQDEATCSALATQQTGYDPAVQAQASAAPQKDSTAKQGKKFLGKIPVTTLIGGPKSIAMGAATGLAGSQVAKQGGVVGDAAGGAAKVMSAVPIPTTDQVIGTAEKTVGGKKSSKAADPAALQAAWAKARTACLQGKGQTAG